eukprot:GEMP01066272.1.p1 GENE.GEMP01066272.1~~GEMP01066272.1.p1  ORF type:complete len:131 (-),score=10.97 GEMP01066272.1:919-1254(-)
MERIFLSAMNLDCRYNITFIFSLCTFLEPKAKIAHLCPPVVSFYPPSDKKSHQDRTARCAEFQNFDRWRKPLSHKMVTIVEFGGNVRANFTTPQQFSAALEPTKIPSLYSR